MYIVCANDAADQRDNDALPELWREMLGREIRSARTARGDRLIDVARRSGVSPQYLSEIERGMKDPSSEMIDAIAGALGMSTMDLAKSIAQRDVQNSTLLLAA